MRSGRRIFTAALCGSMLTALAPTGVSSAWAQSGGAAVQDNTMESVIVTGETIGAGKSRATFDLSKTDIDERPLGADITQSLNKVPGLQASTGDSRGGSFSFEIFLRGLNKEQIGFSLDGIPTGDTRFNGGSPPQRFIDSSNIKNIIVSQSAGDLGTPTRFSLGGTIDFLTDDPKQQMAAALEGGAGSFGYQREYVRLDSGEVLPGLSMYGSYDHQYNDIWAGPNARHDEREHYEFKIVKLFDTGSFLKGHVSYNNQFDNDFDIVTLPQFFANPRSDGATDILSGKPSVDVNYGGALGGARKDVLAYVNSGLQLGDDVLLTANPYYQTLSGFSLSYQPSQRTLSGGNPYAVTSYNATGGAVRPTLVTVSNPNVVGGPADLRVTPRLRERYGLTDELKITDWIPDHTFRIGTWWEGGNSTEQRNFYHLVNSAVSLYYAPGAPAYVQYARATTIETTNFYGQDSWQIIPDTLRLDAGVTWFYIKYKAKSPLEYSAQLNFGQNSPVLPKIALDYKPFEHVEIFGGYAKNFSGISEDAFLGSTAVITPNSIKPTQTENADAGIRYTQDWYSLSLQAYDVALKNAIGIVTNDPTVTDPFEIMRGNVATKAANILGERNLGIELAAIAKWDIWDAFASYSYERARYDNAAVGSPQRAALDSVAVIPGTPVRDIPQNSAFGEIGVSPLEGLRFAGTLRYEGPRVGGDIVAPTTFSEVGIENIPGYTIFGLQARYKIPDFSILHGAMIQLNIDNVTDEAYIASVTSATATQPELGLPGRSLQRYFVGAPTTYTVSLRTEL